MSNLFGNGQISMKKIATLPGKMHETSGLVLYKNKYLITHNDGGNKSEIYILNLKGEHIRTIDVDEAKNTDWEDLTTDDEGRLYIGDFGNNLNKREKCHIYILRKDFMQDDNDRVNAEEITFTYEDQKKYPPSKEDLNYDCEGFVCVKDKLYLFTKCRTKPFTGISYVYELDIHPGKQEAKRVGKIQLCKLGWKFCSVTAADYFPKSDLLVLLTYSRMYIVKGFQDNKFWTGTIRSYQLPIIKQREAICFDGEDSVYMTDEYRKGLGGGNLYHIEIKK